MEVKEKEGSSGVIEALINLPGLGTEYLFFVQV
jgi:hypothetical protein